MEIILESINFYVVGTVMAIAGLAWLAYKLASKYVPHGWAGKPQAAVPVAETEKQPSPPVAKEKFKYAAVVIRGSRVTYEKIKEPIGQPIFGDASTKHPGESSLVMECNAGEMSYCPLLDTPYPEPGDSPSDLYRLLHWPEVRAVYTSISTLWDKLNMLLPWAGVIGLTILGIVGIDKLGR